jgi:hypothetical protein
MACCDAIWICEYKTMFRYFDSVGEDHELSTDAADTPSHKWLAATLSSSVNTKTKKRKTLSVESLLSAAHQNA